MVPDQHEGKFFEYGEETFNNFDMALSERFESLLQTSKTNSFNAADLEQHISSNSRKFHYQTLHKALEEIAVLYNWDRPLMNSPVKKFGKNTALNSVYIFTKLPNDHEELNRFMGKPKMKRQFNHKDLYDKIFNHSNRKVLNVFRSDADININIVDTALWRKNLNLTSEAVTVKNSFKKCLFQLHGNVIQVEAFRVESCLKNYENPHSSSAILNVYSDFVFQRSKIHSVNVICPDINFSMNCNEPTLESVIICGFFQMTKSLLDLQSDGRSFTIWPKQLSASVKSMSHFMRTQNYVAVVKANENYGIWSAIDGNVFTLKLLLKESNIICSLLLESNIKATKEVFDFAKYDDIDFTKKSEDQKIDSKHYFDGNSLESAFVTETKPFSKYVGHLKSLTTKKEEASIQMLKKSYLPHVNAMRRKSSEESVNSSKGQLKSETRPTNHGRSRAEKLLRLGSKNAELRRNSNEEYKESSTKLNIIKQNQRYVKICALILCSCL